MVGGTDGNFPSQSRFLGSFESNHQGKTGNFRVGITAGMAGAAGREGKSPGYGDLGMDPGIWGWIFGKWEQEKREWSRKPLKIGIWGWKCGFAGGIGDIWGSRSRKTRNVLS